MSLSPDKLLSGNTLSWIYLLFKTSSQPLLIPIGNHTIALRSTPELTDVFFDAAHRVSSTKLHFSLLI